MLKKKTYELPEELSRLVQDFLRPDMNKMRHKTKMREVVKSLYWARHAMGKTLQQHEYSNLPAYLAEYQLIREGESVASCIIMGVFWLAWRVRFIEPVNEYIEEEEVGTGDKYNLGIGETREIEPDMEYERDIVEWEEEQREWSEWAAMRAERT